MKYYLLNIINLILFILVYIKKNIISKQIENKILKDIK